MPEIGQLSGSLEEKEQGFKPRSRVYAGPDWGWQTEESYQKIVQERNQGFGSEAVDFIEEKAEQTFGLISQIPGVKQGLDFAGGVVRFVDKTAIQPAIQAAEDPSQAGTPQALAGTVFKAGQMAEQGGAQIARNLGVDPRIGSTVAGAAYETVTGAAVGKIGKIADTLTPPGGGPKFAVAGNVSTPMQMFTAVDNLDAQMSKPLQIASDLKQGSNWQNTVRSLKKGNNTKQIRDFLLKGPGGKIKKGPTGYLLVTADELAANKGGMLDKMLERADNVAKAWERYNKNKSPKAQRALYDIASKNIFDSAELIYGKEGPRSYLTKVTNWLSNDEWHHVFGNKEAGEFILMQAAQDPLVAVNLFKRMENLGLSSSGVAQNIALMKKNRHTNWHDFVKAEGFEPKSPGKPLTTAGSTAPGDFADLSKALGEEIAAGRGDVNDIFKMLDLYAAYNQYVKSKLPEYGAEIISDLPEGVGKSLQIGGYKTKPGRPRKRS